MKHKIALFAGSMVFIALFLSLGIPFLKKIQGHELELNFRANAVDTNTTPEGFRIVEIDLSVESICLNFVTNQQLSRCSEANCDNTCKRDGCAYFGLIYQSSRHESGSCICVCLEESKIKKALTISERKKEMGEYYDDDPFIDETPEFE